MRANRKSKPQHKMIFAISAIFTTSAMFAQRTEGFPLGGKLSRKRLMRGDKSALTKSIHSLRAPLTHQARSRTLYRRAPPDLSKKTSLHDNRQIRFRTIFNLAYWRLSCREVRGDEGGLEGERRFCNAKSADSGFAALNPSPKGGSSPSKVFPCASKVFQSFPCSFIPICSIRRLLNSRAVLKPIFF